MPDTKTEEKKPLSTKDKLKKLNEQKKAIAAKQKELREEFNKGKVERTEANKTKAAARKAVRMNKSLIREAGSKINEVFKSGDADAIEELAGKLEVASAGLVVAMRSFAKAEDELNEL